MKNMKTLLTLSLSLAVAGTLSARLGAADAPKETKPAVAPAAPAVAPATGGNVAVDTQKLRAEFEKLRNETKDLSPEERAQKMKEWREKNGHLLTGAGVTSGVTNADPAARRKEVVDRLTKQIDELEKQKTAGTLSKNDADRLQRLTELRTRYQQYGTPGQLPTRRPTGGTDKKTQVELPAAKPVEKPVEKK